MEYKCEIPVEVSEKRIISKLIKQVSAQSEDGLKAAEGILGYIGNIKKSDNNATIYFVDYISKPKEIKWKSFLE